VAIVSDVVSYVIPRLCEWKACGNGTEPAKEMIDFCIEVENDGTKSGMSLVVAGDSPERAIRG
jgi:hypothetical protein